MTQNDKNKNQMSFAELEKTYDLLAQALDEVGGEKQALFLSKLVMILAHEIGDFDKIEKAVQDAQEDLE